MLVSTDSHTKILLFVFTIAYHPQGLQQLWRIMSILFLLRLGIACVVFLQAFHLLLRVMSGEVVDDRGVVMEGIKLSFNIIVRVTAQCFVLWFLTSLFITIQ